MTPENAQFWLDWLVRYPMMLLMIPLIYGIYLYLKSAITGKPILKNSLSTNLQTQNNTTSQKSSEQIVQECPHAGQTFTK